MTASPAIQVHNPSAGHALPLLTDTSKGETAVTGLLPSLHGITPAYSVGISTEKRPRKCGAKYLGYAEGKDSLPQQSNPGRGRGFP